MNRKLILSIAATAMLSSIDAVAQVTYPKAPKDNTVDVYFGEKVADPYRWLEDDMSAQTAEWVDAENAVTRKYLDNIPMRGCSGTIFTGIHSSTLSPFFGRENVRLIILQYGGNSVPYLKGKEGIDNYMSGLKRQIEYLRKLAPDACFLFIGPSDMSTSIDGEMQTYPILPRLVEAMKAMAEECGIAYWDLYAAMGGRGSMMKWVDAYLAGPDYVHFTPKGARHVGNILYETLEFYHKFYRFRTGKDKLKLSADSTELVVDTTQVPSVQATHTDTVSHDSLNP